MKIVGLSYLRKNQASSWLWFKAGMQLLIPRQHERKCSWMPGEWQLGEGGCLGWPCAHQHTGMSSGILCSRGALHSPRWAGERNHLRGKVNRGGRHSKEFLPVLTGGLCALQGLLKGGDRFTQAYKWRKNVEMMARSPGLESCCMQ